jgi:chemotaxis protein CheC
MELNELQRDALVEAFNIGVGQAAASLASMVNEEVKLSVLTLQLIPRHEAMQQFSFRHSDKICAVAQRFSGAFDAQGFLIFPEEKGLEIVRRMVGDSLSLKELTELEQEAMSEIGNILLNACVGTLANLFRRPLNSTLPTYHLGTPDEVLGGQIQDNDEAVLLLHIDLTLEQHEIQGYVAFLLSVDSIANLVAEVDSYIAQAMGGR